MLKICIGCSFYIHYFLFYFLFNKGAAIFFPQTTSWFHSGMEVKKLLWCTLLLVFLFLLVQLTLDIKRRSCTESWPGGMFLWVRKQNPAKKVQRDRAPQFLEDPSKILKSCCLKCATAKTLDKVSWHKCKNIWPYWKAGWGVVGW